MTINRLVYLFVAALCSGCLSFDKQNYEIGRVAPGGVGGVTLSLQNLASYPLVVDAIEVVESGSPVSIVRTDCKRALPARERCTVHVVAEPKANGDIKATIKASYHLLTVHSYVTASVHATAFPGVQSMVVLGDSISQGLFADSGMKILTAEQNANTAAQFQLNPISDGDLLALKSILPPTPTSFLQRLHTLTPNAKQITDAILGLVGANPALIAQVLPARELSAFSGDKEWSHASLISKLVGHNIQKTNLAVQGTKIDASSGQIEQLRGLYQTKQLPVADYVVFEFGANNILDADVGAFEVAFNTRLGQVVDLHPDAMILVTAIPDIATVLDITAPTTGIGFTFYKDEMAPIWGPGFDDAWAARAIPCYLARLAFQVPTGLTSDVLRAKQVQLNAIIEQAVAAHPSPGKGQVIYGSGITTSDLPKVENLAGDCYHPNVNGHQIIAGSTWKSVFSK